MPETDVKYDLIEAACDFWFHDNDRVRTPFPVRIQAELKRNAQRTYLEWLKNLDGTDRSEVGDEELVSFFEMFLFREALALVGEDDTDLVLTLHHPFMPRVGDLVNDETHGPSRVVGRELEQKDDDKLYMIVAMVAEASDEAWKAEFLIPT